jgi:hypothetical protein
MLRISLALALAGIAAPSFAGDATTLLAAAFGNTIVSTYPDGRTAKLWLQPEGVYTAEGPARDHSNGRWRVKEGKLCFKQSRPFAFGYVYCTHLGQFASGSSWIARAVTGETIQITLVRGKPEPDEG